MKHIVTRQSQSGSLALSRLCSRRQCRCKSCSVPSKDWSPARTGHSCRRHCHGSGNGSVFEPTNVWSSLFRTSSHMRMQSAQQLLAVLLDYCTYLQVPRFLLEGQNTLCVLIVNCGYTTPNQMKSLNDCACAVLAMQALRWFTC